MSFKCAFSLNTFHRARISRFLSAELSKPAFVLCTKKIGVRYAGHSHWQNIKKTKETKDQAKCKAYNVVIRQIRKEVFKGSSDPKMNSKLASIISQAQSMNMPLTTINNAIKRFEFLKKNPLTQVLQYKGSNGVIYLVEISSENLNRTRTEVNILFRKQNIAKADGNLKSAFSPKAYVVAKPPEDTPNASETTVEDAIEVGAEEVEPSEEFPGYFTFIGEESDLNIMKSKLEKKNYTIESAESHYLPRSPVELEEEEMEKLYDFIQKVDEHPEVERVIVNVV